MPVHPVDRKLAVIFAADIAGYSRLMARDEVGTLTRLKACRTIIDGLITSHRGRIFNTAGDSVVADFASAVDAVQCAVAVQATITTDNASHADDEQMQFRIGVHVGDVMVDGENLLGDGVNIAARLEAIAEPGGICVSARVHEDTAGRVDAEFEDAGEQTLKNIARGVRVYRLRTATKIAPSAAAEPNLRNIGFLGVMMRPIYDEFRRGLAAYGHIDGQTIRIHYRWSKGDSSLYPHLIKELLDLPVELIIATGTAAVAAAKQVTNMVPIVMIEVGDPGAFGIVPSLVRPGGNVTGMSNGLHEFAPRNLRLFKEIMPAATRVGILAPEAHRQMGAVAVALANSLETVTQALDLVSRTYYATTADELRNVLAGLDRRTDVLFVHPEHGLLLHRTMIISAATALRIPVVCQQPEYVLDGALLSLDADRREIYRRIPYFVDAILKGARPSDLPVEEPSKSWLMLNLRTAKTLGFDIPGPILMRADQVIE